MPITIVLSDEAAGEIMKQITESLTKRSITPEKPETLTNIHHRGVKATFDEMTKMVAGDTINVIHFAAMAGVPTSAVSDALQRLRKMGEAEMVQKGTWRKVHRQLIHAV